MSAASEIEHLKIILEEEQKQRYVEIRSNLNWDSFLIFCSRALAREKVNDYGEKIAEFIAETSAKCESNRGSK